MYNQVMQINDGKTISVTDGWREGTINSINDGLTDNIVDRTKDGILDGSNNGKEAR